jgi:hypothetical protein
MANRDLLKEAIADAKALKETAIANAKAALEEAFEPRLKSMLSAKLQEMEEEVDEAVTNEAKEEVDEMSNPVMRHGEKGDDKEEKRTEKMKYGKDLAEGDDELEEADLDELLAELDNELNENARTDAEEEGYEDGMEDEKEDMEDDMEDEDIDLEEMSEDDLKSFIEDVISDMVEAGELEAGDEFEVEDDEDEEVDVDVDVEDEETVDENARTDAEEEGYLDGMHDEKEDLDEGALDKLKALYNDKELLSKIITVDGEKVSIKDLLKLAGSGATAGMKKSGAGHDIGPKEGMEEMDEMKKEIDELKADLHEVNLLNAKLLYTNKIFRAKNLQEAQKVKVLEAFDKASSVKEVKLVFETLNEGIKNTPKTPIKESLGSASKAAGVAPTKTIVEVDSQVARWQKLAGIK